MVEARFVPYNDETHRAQLFEMYSEYGKWLDNEVYTHYGVHLFPDGDIQIISERFFPMFTATKPPEGILYIIEVDGEAGGMGRLSKQEEGVGEIGSMYTRPSYRRRGYGTEMLRRLEDKATELGYSILRLDTAGFNVVAQRARATFFAPLLRARV